jgi:hypothetical protein
MDKKNNNLEYYRHGDVHLVRVDSIPEGGKLETTDQVATGEVTGHAHRLLFRHDPDRGVGATERTAQIITGLDGKRYLKVDAPTDLVHEEHHARTIPPGNYEVRLTRETDHMTGLIRRVAD